MQTYFVAFIVALAVAYLITPTIKDLAVKAGAMDAPDARKCIPNLYLVWGDWQFI
jgi:UDP-GlcNAc:undecaprenyl-phosphate GlcNAc-1-phosphate transferase